MHRTNLLEIVLEHAYLTYRDCNVSLYSLRALNLLLQAMTFYLPNTKIQISTTATVYYIIKNTQIEQRMVKRKIINCLLNCKESLAN